MRNRDRAKIFPRDLDMSDVYADADDMFTDFLDQLWHWNAHDRAVERYRRGPGARAGDPYDVAVVGALDYITAARPCDLEFGFDHDHDDARCAWMLAAMDGDDFDHTAEDYPSYDPQMDHFERFGRPAFPNEY